MLEAVYREQRNPAVGIKPDTVRLIMRVIFALGALIFFAMAYFSYVDPTSWHDKYTGEPMSETGGHVLAGVMGVGGIAFLLASWASGFLPITFNGQMLDDGGRKGTAWQISVAGLANMTWGKKGLIPWSALDYVQDDVDGYGEPCLNVYFKSKQAVAQYLGEEDAADWTAGVSYALEIANTSVSMTQTIDALNQYCPSLFRYYAVEEPASVHPANDAI
jgi:hypothetical protein